jgi:hypothetical protein
MPLKQEWSRLADTTARDALIVTRGDIEQDYYAFVLADGVYYAPLTVGTGSTIWYQRRPTTANGFVLAVTSTDNGVARFNGTTGQLQDSSGPTMDDSGNIAMASTDTIDGKDLSVLFANVTVAPIATTWTPTITNGTNVTASGTIDGTYTRTENVVAFSFTASITHTAGAPTASDFEFTLPVASNIGATTDAIGHVTGSAVSLGRVTGSIANDRGVANYTIASSGAQVVMVTGRYEVI